MGDHLYRLGMSANRPPDTGKGTNLVTANGQAVGHGRAEEKEIIAAAGGFWGKDGFGFDDLIDMVNPLQHIPVLSNFYRALTGDDIGVGPRLIGAAAIGGPLGFATAAVGAMMENGTTDVVATALDSATGESANHLLTAKQAERSYSKTNRGAYHSALRVDI